MSRMFRSISSTWNVYVGCRFECSYCNARKAALTRFKHVPRYKDGFTPKLVEEELKRRFKPGEFIFVAYMGDISWALHPWVERILARIRQFPETYFLLQTKHPKVFWEWDLVLPPNVYLGTTIESNRDYHLTKAPAPIERFRYLTGYPHNRKFLSIEPIMDFDLEELLTWVKLMQPNIIEIGADNYHNNLLEPPWWKVEKLIENLREMKTALGKSLIVIEKEGLHRLKVGSGAKDKYYR